MAEADPRMRGFNYGSPHDSPMPPVYLSGQMVALILGQRSREAGDASWAMQMALRDVRHAVTATEKAKAVSRLELKLKQYGNLVPA